MHASVDDLQFESCLPCFIYWHLASAGKPSDFYFFLCEIIHLRATDIAQYDAFWHEAPALRPITNRTKMIIAGTAFSSPPDCLLAWNEKQKNKMISQAAEESNATEAQAEV
jgi:hypothetical protein